MATCRSGCAARSSIRWVTDSSEIPCRVSGNEPVLANIGEARLASCGGARVIPREVVPLLAGLTPYRLRRNAEGCRAYPSTIYAAAKTPVVPDGSLRVFRWIDGEGC